MGFRKFYLVFVTVMFGLEASLLGFNLADQNNQDALVSGVLAGFWFIALLWVVFQTVNEADFNRTVGRSMDNIAKLMQRDLQEQDGKKWAKQTAERVYRERNNRQAVKKTEQSTRTAATAQAQKVSKPKEGVQNGRQKKR